MPANGGVGEGRRLWRRRARSCLRAFVKPDEHRVRKCGRVSTGLPTRVATTPDAGKAHYRGLQTCGSMTVCPVCSAKVRHGRATDIDTGVSGHLGAGGGAAFLTLTAPHDRGMSLDELWDAVSGSWRALVSGRARGTLRDRWGLLGTIRSTEITFGRSGWHPHLHLLLLTPLPLTLDELRDLGEFIRVRWVRQVVSLGYRPPDQDHGVRLMPVYSADRLGGYLTKVDPDGERGPGAELSRGDLKQGRNGSRTPFQILGDLMEHGRPADWALFSEWITASKGRHMIQWSPGLRELLLPGVPELTDEEIAAECDHQSVDVATIDPPLWQELVRRDLTDWLLSVCEHPEGGLPGMLEFLDQVGMDVVAEEQAHGPPLLRFRRDEQAPPPSRKRKAAGHHKPASRRRRR